MGEIIIAFCTSEIFNSLIRANKRQKARDGKEISKASLQRDFILNLESAQSVILEMFSFISGMMTPLDNKDDACKETTDCSVEPSYLREFSSSPDTCIVMTMSMSQCRVASLGFWT